MSYRRFARGVRQMGGFAGGTSRLARPPAVLPEPDVKPSDCWTATNDDYGHDGVAFTAAGDVWCYDSTTLRRVDFPGMSTVAQTIDVSSLTSVDQPAGSRGVACVASGPIIGGTTVDGESVLVDAGADTVIRNFGDADTDANVQHAVYSPQVDKLYVASFGVGLDDTLYRMDPDGSNLETVWASGTESFAGSTYLIVAADGAVWWTGLSHVYRAEGLTVVSISSSGAGQLVHDPQDPTAVLAYPATFGPPDPRKFSYAAGTISLSTPGCTENIEGPEAAAMRQDGTAGVIVTFPSWVWGA